jgi:hypothetical protein
VGREDFNFDSADDYSKQFYFSGVELSIICYLDLAFVTPMLCRSLLIYLLSCTLAGLFIIIIPMHEI